MIMDSSPENSINRQATRVFEKSSLDSKITIYLGKRDFVDHITHVDPINGVVLIDPVYSRDRKVFVQLAALKYNLKEFLFAPIYSDSPPKKKLYLAKKQVHPIPEGQQPQALTQFQERLLRKLGANAYPFSFELPQHCPASVTLLLSSYDDEEQCGVHYELKSFVGDLKDDYSAKMTISKITHALSKQSEQPSTEVSKNFIMSPAKLYLEASLDKELYHHGEVIEVNLHIANNSNRTVKKIKVSAKQIVSSSPFSIYKRTIAEAESGIGIEPGCTLNKVFSLEPTLASNKYNWGMAFERKFEREHINFASSTIVADPLQCKHSGIIVKYIVKVKLSLGVLAGALVAELPFILMNPKPKNDTSSTASTVQLSPSHTVKENEDTNLIQLDDDVFC